MKRLNTNNAGRMPLWQADLDWLQQAYTEPIEVLIKELKIDSRHWTPVTGCKVTKTDQTIAMSAGWFWWDGELLPVRELKAVGTNSFTNPVVHLEKVAFSNPDGARNFIHADLTPVTVTDVWQDDYLQPTIVERSATFTTGVHILPGSQTLVDQLKIRIAGNESEWRSSELGAISFKRIGRMVVLKGATPGTYMGTPPAIPLDGGFPEPLGGKASLFTIGSDEVEVYIQGTTLYATGAGAGEKPLDGMMYMAEQPAVIPVDMNVIVCEQ